LGGAAAFAQLPADAGEGFVGGVVGFAGAGADFQDVAGVGGFGQLGEAGGLGLGIKAIEEVRKTALARVGGGKSGGVIGEFRVVGNLRHAIPNLQGDAHHNGGLGIGDIQADGSPAGNRGRTGGQSPKFCNAAPTCKPGPPSPCPPAAPHPPGRSSPHGWITA